MAKTPLQREQSAKVAANAKKPMTRTDAAEAMERFKWLASDLLQVPRDKIEEEERSFRQRRGARQKPKKNVRGRKGTSNAG
jgi:hypothetical protein